LGPFFIQFASSYPVVLFHHCSIPGPCCPHCSFVLSHGFELHLFPPCEQLLMAVVLGAGGCISWHHGIEATVLLEHT
jgi:hypothetical protein